jgi:hypothetical protein
VDENIRSMSRKIESHHFWMKFTLKCYGRNYISDRWM